jgi:hypothetical protein
MSAMVASVRNCLSTLDARLISYGPYFGKLSELDATNSHLIKTFCRSRTSGMFKMPSIAASCAALVGEMSHSAMNAQDDNCDKIVSYKTNVRFVRRVDVRHTVRHMSAFDLVQ